MAEWDLKCEFRCEKNIPFQPDLARFVLRTGFDYSK